MLRQVRRRLYRSVYALLVRACDAAGRRDIIDAPRRDSDDLAPGDVAALMAVMDERLRRLETREASDTKRE